MAISQGKTTKDLHLGGPRQESTGSASRGTRILPRTQDGSHETRRGSGDEDAAPSVSSLPPLIETLANDRKSERLVNQWVDEILGEDASFSEDVSPAPPLAGPAVPAAPRPPAPRFWVTPHRAFQLTPAKRMAACLVGIAALLAVAFVAVPSPRGTPAAASADPITVLAPVAQAPWLDMEIALFNRQNAQGYQIARVAGAGDADDVPRVVQGQSRPTIFAPNRAGDVERLNVGWLQHRHSRLIADINDPQAFRRVSQLPLVVLNAPWVTARQRAGGIAFLSFLAKQGSRP